MNVVTKYSQDPLKMPLFPKKSHNVAHHDMHHDGRLTIRGTNATGLRFFDVMGREIGYSPPRTLQSEVKDTVRASPRMWGGKAIKLVNDA